MFNGGAMSVLYEVDLSPLRSLESENFHHPILTCLNPSGEIAPGMSSNLEWIFSPLESKTYSVKFLTKPKKLKIKFAASNASYFKCTSFVVKLCALCGLYIVFEAQSLLLNW